MDRSHCPHSGAFARPLPSRALQPCSRQSQLWFLHHQTPLRETFPSLHPNHFPVPDIPIFLTNAHLAPLPRPVGATSGPCARMSGVGPAPWPSARLSFCPGDEPAGSVGECAPGLRLLGQCTTGCGGREGLVGAGLWVTAAAAPSSDLLRVRQEVAAAAARSPSGLEVHLPSSTAGQRRKQGLAQHRDVTAPAGAPSFSERYRGACISERPLHSLCLFRGYRAAVGRPITWFLHVRSTARTSPSPLYSRRVLSEPGTVLGPRLVAAGQRPRTLLG